MGLRHSLFYVCRKQVGNLMLSPFITWQYYNEFCTLRKVAIPTIMTMRLHTWEGLWIIWCTCSTPPTPLLPFPRPPKSASDICQYTIGLTGKTSPRSFQSYTIPIFINQDYGPLLLTGLFDLWRIGKRHVIPSEVGQVLAWNEAVEKDHLQNFLAKGNAYNPIL